MTLKDWFRHEGEVLLAIFIVLKLTGLIHWSWWWVLGPLWIWPLIALVVYGAIETWERI